MNTRKLIVARLGEREYRVVGGSNEGDRCILDQMDTNMRNYMEREGIDELAPDEKPVRWTAFVALLLWFGWWW